LSWAFQILPYLEAQQVYNIRTTADISRTSVPMYFCPSRRGPTRHPIEGTYLMDYAAAVPSRSLGERPPTPDYAAPHPSMGSLGCARLEFWSSIGGAFRFESDMGSRDISQFPAYVGHMGVIVRSGWCATCPKGSQDKKFYTRISFHQITDGSSNTLVLGEKWLQPQYYEVGDWHDDRGWSDGWDPDTLRSTMCPPSRDLNVIGSTPGRDGFPYAFGSAHPEIFNVGFADASVRSLGYSIDLNVFNHLGHRSDGETVNLEAL
jgi:hypothetical protein